MRPRELYRVLSGETRGTLILSGLMWAVALAAVVSMIGGNRTAINGVVACGFGGAVLTAAGIALARQDIRMHERRTMS